MQTFHPRSITALKLQQWLQVDEVKPQLIDVREEQELELARFPSEVIHLPLSCSNVWLHSIRDQLRTDRPVVVICHAGVRSLHFGLWLLEQNWELEVWNLEGGIDAWSVQVDTAVPRY
ncbi:MAG: sulfurtransferase [Cyanobium sp. NAT70]|nr:sulfurtransferase [Cyanobium sp. NAT70]